VSAARRPPARAPFAPGAQTLADAARVVAQVARRGQSATDALRETRGGPERAKVQAIALGSIRWYLRLAAALEPLLARGRSDFAPELSGLLVAAAHQIEYSQHPPQLTVHAAVDAARILGQPRASGLTNAVLRRFVSDRSRLLTRVDATLAGSTAHPAWLVEALEQAWPGDAPALLAANNAHPPLVLRVDGSRATRAGYLAQLAAAGLAAAPVDWAPAAVRLERALPAPEIPGFGEGLVSIQDAGAQLAAALLGAQPGMRVLDACAAPGGKTLHLLELAAAPIELLALDVDPARLKRVEENLSRAGRQAQLAALDMRTLTPASPLVGARGFDRILLDAPCSATGVIRRHPDIKLLRRSSDIATNARAQAEILQAAFDVLAPGGRLLYCTCSVLPQENEDVVRAFLAVKPQARVQALAWPEGLPPGVRERPLGAQLLPGTGADTDGFYYACLEKTTAGD
jgi:16S rRNA (cytosine967-C5)-methyltransferase